MENGGFRGLLGIEKMVLCSKLCCNIAKLKKHMGKVTYAPVIGWQIKDLETSQTKKKRKWKEKRIEYNFTSFKVFTAYKAG